MSPVEIGIIGFVVFFALLATGLPVGISMALVGFGGYIFLRSFPVAVGIIKFAGD